MLNFAKYLLADETFTQINIAFAFYASFYSWIARDVIALIVKPLDVKIADQRYVNACKNTDSKDYRA